MDNLFTYVYVLSACILLSVLKLCSSEVSDRRSRWLCLYLVLGVGVVLASCNEFKSVPSISVVLNSLFESLKNSVMNSAGHGGVMEGFLLLFQSTWGSFFPCLVCLVFLVS